MSTEESTEKAGKKRAIVLECSPLMRLGIIGLLNAQQHLLVCGDTDDVTVARRQIVEKQPDFVLLDLELNRGDGFELIRDLPTLAPRSRGIVVTAHEDSMALQRAFRTGARGFMSKYDQPLELLAGIDAVSRGELFASRRIAGMVLQILAVGSLGNERSAISKLSNRELQVFRLFGRGLGVKATAAELGLSSRTVETHQARIKVKLGSKTWAEVQRRAAAWDDEKAASPAASEDDRAEYAER